MGFFWISFVHLVGVCEVIEGLGWKADAEESEQWAHLSCGLQYQGSSEDCVITVTSLDPGNRRVILLAHSSVLSL